MKEKGSFANLFLALLAGLLGEKQGTGVPFPGLSPATGGQKPDPSNPPLLLAALWQQLQPVWAQAGGAGPSLTPVAAGATGRPLPLPPNLPLNILREMASLFVAGDMAGLGTLLRELAAQEGAAAAAGLPGGGRGAAAGLPGGGQSTASGLPGGEWVAAAKPILSSATGPGTVPVPPPIAQEGTYPGPPPAGPATAGEAVLAGTEGTGRGTGLPGVTQFTAAAAPQAAKPAVTPAPQVAHPVSASVEQVATNPSQQAARPVFAPLPTAGGTPDPADAGKAAAGGKMLIGETAAAVLNVATPAAPQSTAGVHQAAGTVREVVKQVVENAQLLLGKETASLQLHLKPEFLGSLQLSVTVAHGALHALFTAENAATAALIQAHLPELQQSLADQGISWQQVNVAVNTGGYAQTPSGGHGASQDGGFSPGGGYAGATDTGGGETPAAGRPFTGMVDYLV